MQREIVPGGCAACGHDPARSIREYQAGLGPEIDLRVLAREELPVRPMRGGAPAIQSPVSASTNAPEQAE